jgi:hypothetical protein
MRACSGRSKPAGDGVDILAGRSDKRLTPDRLISPERFSKQAGLPAAFFFEEANACFPYRDKAGCLCPKVQLNIAAAVNAACVVLLPQTTDSLVNAESHLSMAISLP